MKKLFSLLLFVALFVCYQPPASYAQKGKTVTMAVDTLQGNETVNFALSPTFSGEYSLTIQVLCTELGGTSDGSLRLEMSLDGTSWEAFTSTANVMYAFPNDTLTIVDGAVVTWTIVNTPWSKYRFVGAGTASDTTLISGKYIFK